MPRRAVVVWSLTLLIIAAIALLSAGCGESSSSQSSPTVEQSAPTTPAAPTTPTVEPTPAPKTMQIAAVKPVTLDPGTSNTVELHVERNGNDAEIQFRVDDAPEGVAVKADPIPAGTSVGRLHVAADEKLGDNELNATLQLTATAGEQQATQSLALTVSKLSVPNFVAPPSVILEPGKSTVVPVTIELNGFAAPLNLKLEGLSGAITGKVAGVAPGESKANVEIAAADGTPDSKQTARLAISLYGRDIGVDIPVHVEKQPYTLNTFMVVTLKPGETKSVQIPVERRSYKGPIRVELPELPQGLTVPAVDVAPDQTAAALQFKAAADVPGYVRTVKVVSTAGQLTRTNLMVVRVSSGDNGFLPREITATEDLFRLLRRGSFGGRLSAKSKQVLLDAYGGTPESEQAVLRGLQWLATHQQTDGSWPLDNYNSGIFRCDCRDEFEAEVVTYDTAGTAFGLLPFLGYGITHQGVPEGQPELAKYQRNVDKAISFLVKNQVKSDNVEKNGNLGGNLYSHAIATMALCEAYGLSGDEKLKVPAQMATRYLIESQHPSGGGWRYSPRQAGDMSATGWMLLAIRNGQLAGLRIEKSPLTRAERFIESCSAGPTEAKMSRYAYEPNSPAKLTLSAAGLLSRQYLGWPSDNADLNAGCKYMMQNLPPETADKLGQIYYYYYATQVLHHMEGSDFDLWNLRMREHLIRTQEKEGHAAGSWDPDGADWGNRGGRLYSTSLALMTLQVYYRHLPLYRPVSRT